MAGYKMWFVYLLNSPKRRWYYVGSTNNLERRLLEHNSGKVQATKPFKPFTLCYSKSFLTEKEARSFEQRIKRRRIEKETLIRQIEGKK